MIENHRPETIYGTTIVTVRKGGKVVIAGDGQVSLGNTVMYSARSLNSLCEQVSAQSSRRFMNSPG